ncbi:hypothetical protein AAVH_31593 [Aphelenchoides avenae]|nr:hypothetical protein AAVH_31593 [Aphelenchus avenae]
MVRQKVQAREPLDWTELFLLKHDHCCRVIPKERCLKRFRLEAPSSRQCRQLENEILNLYALYQQTLDHCKPADNAYTRLAHMIMLAEAHWYAARIASDPILRKHNYEIAARRYEELFAMAQHSLEPGDRSLLTIIEKITQIMLESSHASHLTFGKCRSAIASAEEALDRQPDLKRERKLIKIKDNLVQIEASLL